MKRKRKLFRLTVTIQTTRVGADHLYIPVVSFTGNDREEATRKAIAFEYSEEGKAAIYAIKGTLSDEMKVNGCLIAHYYVDPAFPTISTDLR